MGVAARERPCHGGVEAVHARGLAPVPRGQRQVCRERVRRRVVRAVFLVDVPHELAPSEHLANEAFGRRKRNATGAICRVHATTEIQRIEQTQVERCRKCRMEELGCVLGHRVLERTEPPEPLDDERVHGAFRLLRRDRPSEAVNRTERGGVARGDEGHDLARDGVWREGQRGRRRGIPLPRLAVLGVVVPRASGRLAAVHQQPGRPARGAIERLEAAGAAFREHATIERRVGRKQGVRMEREPRERPERLTDLSLGGFERVEVLQLVAFARLGDRVVVPRIRDVVSNGMAGAAPRLGVVPHRTQQEYQLLRVVAPARRLRRGLDVQHARVGWWSRQQGVARAQLVVEHDNPPARAPVRPRREASDRAKKGRGRAGQDTPRFRRVQQR